MFIQIDNSITVRQDAIDIVSITTPKFDYDEVTRSINFFIRGIEDPIEKEFASNGWVDSCLLGTKYTDAKCYEEDDMNCDGCKYFESVNNTVKRKFIKEVVKIYDEIIDKIQKCEKVELNKCELNFKMIETETGFDIVLDK